MERSEAEALRERLDRTMSAEEMLKVFQKAGLVSRYTDASTRPVTHYYKLTIFGLAMLREAEHAHESLHNAYLDQTEEHDPHGDA